MGLTDESDAFERAADRPAFPNGTSWEIWSGNWCYRCVHDGMGSDDPEGKPWCPLITVAVCGQRTPAEWTDTDPPLGAYTCSEFTARQ